MTTQTTLRLPAELKAALQREAQVRGYTMSDLILFILRERFRTPTFQG